ncbi:MAG: Maf family protein [Thermomicrobiales bacterium]
MIDQPPLVLASGSSRRWELLSLLGVPFIVDPSGADETLPVDVAPEEVVRSLALTKAREVTARHPGAYILGADTLVTIDGLILGKPTDAADGARMLRLLAGRAHRVPTGVALIAPDGTETALVETATVTMHPYTEIAIGAYLSTGEPFDKAGAYAVQGAGGALVASVEGCYTTVVGFPLCRVAALLRDAGFSLARGPTDSCLPGHSCALNPRHAREMTGA